MMLPSRKTTLLMLAAALLAANPAGAAESLAGKVGNKRSTVFFPQWSEGGCQGMYKAYIAAPGHSAYASTVNGPGTYSVVCGARLNLPSQAAAEKAAVASCEAGRKKYKATVIGTCKVAASK
jgi:hypothetical protein